jgi:hypothetical protein
MLIMIHLSASSHTDQRNCGIHSPSLCVVCYIGYYPYVKVGMWAIQIYGETFFINYSMFFLADEWTDRRGAVNNGSSQRCEIATKC